MRLFLQRIAPSADALLPGHDDARAGRRRRLRGEMQQRLVQHREIVIVPQEIREAPAALAQPLERAALELAQEFELREQVLGLFAPPVQFDVPATSLREPARLAPAGIGALDGAAEGLRGG